MDSLTGVSLRKFTPDDLPFLARVYASTREEELVQVDWTEEQKGAFVAHQFAAQHQHYQTYFHDIDYLVILRHGTPIGRLYIGWWKSEIRIVDITILPEGRGGGIGGALIRCLQEVATAGGRTLSIHVEKMNRARALYTRLGFEITEDKGVYDFWVWRPQL